MAKKKSSINSSRGDKCQLNILLKPREKRLLKKLAKFNKKSMNKFIVDQITTAAAIQLWSRSWQ